MGFAFVLNVRTSEPFAGVATLALPLREAAFQPAVSDSKPSKELRVPANASVVVFGPTTFRFNASLTVHSRTWIGESDCNQTLPKEKTFTEPVAENVSDCSLEPIEPPAVSDKPFAEMPLEGALLNVIEVGVHAELVPV